MTVLEYEITIKAPLERVYTVSQDYAVRYEWDPFPEEIKLLNGADRIEKGVVAFVRAKSGMTMDVIFVQVDPPNRAAIKMLRGPFILKSFAGSWIFETTHEEYTKARFVYSIKVKTWAVPVITEKIACWYFAAAIKRRLDGLQAYCERMYHA